MHVAALYYWGGGPYSAYIKQLHVHPFYEEGKSRDVHVRDKKANSYL